MIKDNCNMLNFFCLLKGICFGCGLEFTKIFQIYFIVLHYRSSTSNLHFYNAVIKPFEELPFSELCVCMYIGYDELITEHFHNHLCMHWRDYSLSFLFLIFVMHNVGISDWWQFTERLEILDLHFLLFNRFSFATTD